MENARKEYGRHYRDLTADRKPAAEPLMIASVFEAPQTGRREAVLLGSAGQRIITAGLNTTQKNEYNITVLRGPSISELILSPEEIDFTGIRRPDVILALAQEGVDRRQEMFKHLDSDALVLQADGVELPASSALIYPMDLKSRGIKKPDWALASLGLMAKEGKIISPEMLTAALRIRFKHKTLETALELIKQVESSEM